MKTILFIITVSIICFSLFAQTGMEVQHIAGVTIPDLPYDLVVGKADSLLHFYKANANQDSIWINTFGTKENPYQYIQTAITAAAGNTQSTTIYIRGRGTTPYTQNL